MIRTGSIRNHGLEYRIVDLAAYGVRRLPYVHRILLENLLRKSAGDRDALAPVQDWLATGRSDAEIAFWPGRVMMHDTTCGPALVDIAAMRAARSPKPGAIPPRSTRCSVDVSTDHAWRSTSSARRALGTDQHGARDGAQCRALSAS
jgi:aconitate hydratase